MSFSTSSESLGERTNVDARKLNMRELLGQLFDPLKILETIGVVIHLNTISLSRILDPLGLTVSKRT
jgi:hypothetical protein